MSKTELGDAVPMSVDNFKYTDDDITREKFFGLLMSSGSMNNTYYMGVKTLKIPQDLWNYQEIFNNQRPTLVIETGTFNGGSALYMAHLFENMGGPGRIISIDIDSKVYPQHPRITYLTGSSTDPEIVEKVKSLIKPTDKIMVILDSDHSSKHVEEEMRLYGPLVTDDQYMIVEDTFIFNSEKNESPRVAVNRFFDNPEHQKNWIIDQGKHKFQVTLNPYGYLFKKGLWGRTAGLMVK